MATTKYVDINGLSRFKANFQSLLANKFGDLKYYEYSPGSNYGTMMFLYSGDYDYSTTVDEGYTFGRYLYNLIYYLNTAKTQTGIDTNINSGSLSTTLKGFFSKLLNALSENSYCICNFSCSVLFFPNNNEIDVMFGDGTIIIYSVSNSVETIIFNKSNTYHAGTNISIANDGTINNTLDVSGKEDATNKVTSLSSSSTDTQYPSAKCVYDLIGDIETLLSEV